MIGITTYRDYFAATNRNGSSKYESLCQYVIDIAEALGEEAEIVPSSIIRQADQDFSKYSRIVLFEHPSSFLDKRGQAGFTTPNVETHYIQFHKIIKYEGELLGCNMEWQKPGVWTPRIESRRRHSVTGLWDWPSDKQIFDMFDRGLKNSLTEKLKQTRLTRQTYSVGDSHTLMMWRPNSTAEAIPARTLYRTLKDGLDSVVPSTAKNVTLCFGNIDLRHHINRQSDPVATADELAKEYVRQAAELDVEEVRICELLPIITPTRRVSKAYYYKDDPHSGSTEERMVLREKFNEALHRYGKDTKNVVTLHHPASFFDSDGLLTEKAVERTNGGIHLSTHFYEWSASSNQHTPEFAWLP